MKKRGIIYAIITILFIIISITILSKTDLNNNVMLSNSIQVILILYLLRISIGCLFYIRKQYEEKKYSYAIILNLGLFIFLNLNIIRLIDLFIENFNNNSISSIYMNTLESFSFFAMLTLPCIIILSVYSIVSNFVLMKKEGVTYRNMLGVVLGFISIIGLFLSQFIYYITSQLILDSSKLLI